MVIYKEQLSTIDYEFNANVNNARILSKKNPESDVLIAYFQKNNSRFGIGGLVLGNNNEKCQEALDLGGAYKNGEKISIEFSKSEVFRSLISKIIGEKKINYFGIVKVNDRKKYWFYNSFKKTNGKRRKLLESSLTRAI